MEKAGTLQVDTMYMLLIEKGTFTEADFLTNMKDEGSAESLSAAGRH
jgi:hypothetical protein